MSEGPPSFILRIQKDEMERQLFNLHTFYIGIKRDWSRRARVLFVRKDAFTGSGIIGSIIGLNDLEEPERKLFIENNWYAKLVFSRLARFLPPVPINDTPVAGQNPLTLHCASIAGSELLRIEGLAPAKIIS